MGDRAQPPRGSSYLSRQALGTGKVQGLPAAPLWALALTLTPVEHWGLEAERRCQLPRECEPWLLTSVLTLGGLALPRLALGLGAGAGCALPQDSGWSQGGVTGLRPANGLWGGPHPGAASAVCPSKLGQSILCPKRGHRNLLLGPAPSELEGCPCRTFTLEPGEGDRCP